MSRLVSIRLGCGDYDRTRALFDGSVQPEGVALTCESMAPHDLFLRVLVDKEFDAAEMSISNLTTLIARGDHELIGIPVFLSRVYRHGFVFVNVNAGIRDPQDLVGKRVGVPDYPMTAAVWVRAFLQHDYGVQPQQLLWFQGGLNRPGRAERIKVQLPPDVAIHAIPSDGTLSKLLEAGDLDAIVAPSIPDAIKHGSPAVRRLFPDYRAVEAAYYRRTGLVHIMHAVAIRRSMYEQHPWIARTLFDAFDRAKRECISRFEETGTPQVTLTWLQASLEAERASFGDDHWPYGVEANRKTLEALVTYMFEQGLSERRVPIEELFAPETLRTP